METISDRLRALRAHLGLNGDQFGALCDASDWILTGAGPNPTGDQRERRLADIFARLDERGKTAVFRVAESESAYIIQAQDLRNGTR